MTSGGLIAGSRGSTPVRQAYLDAETILSGCGKVNSASDRRLCAIPFMSLGSVDWWRHGSVRFFSNKRESSTIKLFRFKIRMQLVTRFKVLDVDHRVHAVRTEPSEIARTGDESRRETHVLL